MPTVHDGMDVSMANEKKKKKSFQKIVRKTRSAAKRFLGRNFQKRSPLVHVVQRFFPFAQPSAACGLISVIHHFAFHF